MSSSRNLSCKVECLTNQALYFFFRKSSVRGRNHANCLVSEKIMTGPQLTRSIQVHYASVHIRKNAQNTIWMLELFLEKFTVMTVYALTVPIVCKICIRLGYLTFFYFWVNHTSEILSDQQEKKKHTNKHVQTCLKQLNNYD